MDKLTMYWYEAKTTSLQTALEKSRFGLVTDVDGTISPIVAEPDRAQVTARNRELLQVLQAVLPLVAVVSGRAAADIRERVGVPGLVYVGNHGFERWIDGQVSPMPEALAYRPRLEAALDDLAAIEVPGLRLEDKGVTLSVHYRQTADPEAVAAQYGPQIRAIAERCTLNLFQGRMVFELRPPLAADKGQAFRDLVDEFRLDAALYIGDDTTDVDAFRAARQLRQAGRCYALAVGVESADMPQAVGDNSDLLVAGVSEVEALLAWLAATCKASLT